MLIPNKFNGYVAGRRTYNTGMEPILLGAAIGGGTSAMRGGNPIQGALLGGLTGGIGNYALTGTIPSMLGSAASAAPITALTGPAAAGMAAEGAATAGLGGAAAPAAAETAAINMGAVSPAAALSPQGLGAFAYPDAFAQAAMNPAAAPAAEAAAAPAASGQAPAASNLSFMGQEPGFRSSFGALPAPQASKSLADIWKALPMEKKLLYGGGGALGLMALMGQQRKVPGAAPYTGPLSRFSYNPSTYTPMFAAGGPATLGSYSDGGRLLKGPGDGMSDHIPATIANKQPARLADGEFVIPADVVSHLGNGSTDAGAKQLYAMMDRIRAARTGTKKQGKQINPEQFMPTRTNRKAKRFDGGGISGGDAGGSNANSGEGPGPGLAAQGGEAAAAAQAAEAAALGFAGPDGFGYGGPDMGYDSGYRSGAGLDATRSALNPEYKPQESASVNTNIYRPGYTNYATGLANAVSSYGQNMTNPFGDFMNPFVQAAAPGGIGGSRYYPEFDDYGLSGLR